MDNKRAPGLQMTRMICYFECNCFLDSQTGGIRGVYDRVCSLWEGSSENDVRRSNSGTAGCVQRLSDQPV